MKKLLLALPLLINTAWAKFDLNAVQDAARARNLGQLNKLADAAQGEVLEIYARYYLLNAQLGTLNPEQANEFLTRFADSPLTERFRNEWLKELGKRQNWAAFAAEYAKADNPGTELQCYNAQAALAEGRREPALNLKPVWFNASPQAESCGPIFDILFATDQLTEADRWQRLRLALADDRSDFATQLANDLPHASAINAKTLNKIRQNPEKHTLDGSSRANRELSIYALTRLSRSNIDAAAANLSRLENWPEADLRFSWQQIAFQAARKHHPNANQWFGKGGGNGLDANERAWSIRAALRQLDWKAAQTRIDALPEKERNELVWRYWRARALKETGQTQPAQAAFAAIADGTDYHNLLAREELGQIAENPNIQYRANEDEIRAIHKLPGVQRTQALMEGGWRSEAIREWNWGMKGLTDQKLLAAAEFARRQGWYDRAIYSAERTRQLHDYSIRYLTPYREVIEPQARSAGLDPAWVYGVMRQESRFINTARSGVGASGLMQLMPATAKWVARKIGIKGFAQSDVNDIATNVTLGTTYLQHIWQQLGMSQVLATAAYNAGPSRARQWQTDQAFDATIYIETIPFSETRDYVKKVMSNATHYAHTFRSAPSPLKARISIIPAKGTAIEGP